MTDIEIAQACKLANIDEIAEKAGIEPCWLLHYGQTKAKVDCNIIKQNKKGQGKLILVTAMTPTPAGEGKTTTSVGLGDGLSKIGKRTIIALREPSLGPVFGVKGGAAGGRVRPGGSHGGYQPAFYWGTFTRLEAANNLLAAMIDNHIQSGNALGIDPRKISWKRCMDMNDRQLRFIVDGLGGHSQRNASRRRISNNRGIGGDGDSLPRFGYRRSETAAEAYRYWLYLR